MMDLAKLISTLTEYSDDQSWSASLNTKAVIVPVHLLEEALKQLRAYLMETSENVLCKTCQSTFEHEIDGTPVCRNGHILWMEK